jgi:hypothetical protein
LVLRFDQQISAASRSLVLRSDNWPNGGAANLSGPFISGGATNQILWMADTNEFDGTGLRAWSVPSDGVLATNDLGSTVVQAGTNSDLNLAPFDVALDSSNRIYTIQFVSTPGDPAHRVLRFPAFDGTPLTNADWRIGSGQNNLCGASGIAVIRPRTYVAVAFTGAGEGSAASAEVCACFAPWTGQKFRREHRHRIMISPMWRGTTPATCMLATIGASFGGRILRRGPTRPARYRFKRWKLASPRLPRCSRWWFTTTESSDSHSGVARTSFTSLKVQRTFDLGCRC